MRKALIVGVDEYQYHNSLKGCINDALAVNEVLERHGNGMINFDSKLLTGAKDKSPILRGDLKYQITELFKDESDVALFYFSGHGHIEDSGGYLMTSECNSGDEGLSMDELLGIINRSPARNKIIILDCCHSGDLGTPEDKAILAKGVTILTASSANQYATEKNGSGVFTTLLIDALHGSAANLMGDITLGSIYAHIDKSLGPWQQRPIFKANIESFITLRKVQPLIQLQDLLSIIELFKEKDSIFALDPSYEHSSEVAVEENTKKFAILQKYNKLNLLIPLGTEHMYHAAMESKTCVLTVLGQHYWKLVKSKRL